MIRSIRRFATQVANGASAAASTNQATTSTAKRIAQTSASVNEVTLVGHVGSNPELRVLNGQ